MGLVRDERGSILLQATITIGVLMGMIGLALDGARFLLLNNDLQDLADAAALAGAADLDGSTRADNAITDAQNFLVNCPDSTKTYCGKWWNVSGAQIQSVHLYKSLADLDNGIDTDAEPRRAQFIKVTTGTWQVAPTFLAAVGASTNAITQASAVAQASITICKPLPMFLCNPNEPNPFSPVAGQFFKFSLTGNPSSNQYSPGDFNLVDTPDGRTGDQDIAGYLSQQSNFQCASSGLSPAQGSKTNATIIGINVRFDQQPNGQGQLTGLDQTPAPITIDGQNPPTNPSGNRNCNPSQLNDVSGVSLPLPDDVLGAPTGSVASSSGPPPVGSLTSYWSNHHPGTMPGGYTTRWQIYQDEVGAIGNAATWTTDTTEPHGPVCAPTNLESGPKYTAQRRIMSLAVVDCQFWGVGGNKVNNIPINSYLDFFLTKPSDGNIYAEYVGAHSLGAGNATGLRMVVQLVR